VDDKNLEMDSLDKKIITVADLIEIPELCIPAYQRPYKWTEANLNSLLADVRVAREDIPYRLGTIVFHRDPQNHEEALNIVDGQQRTLTLFLLVKAVLDVFLNGEQNTKLVCSKVRQQLECLNKPVEDFLQRQCFTSSLSHYNLYENFRAAKRAVKRSDFSEKDVEFILNRCEVVTFVLDDITEAFQFFDSQNARGRDLDPHDLLKAYHLREFSQQEADLKAETVRHWETLDSNSLADLFARYLYRIRNWAQGKSAKYFSKDQAGLFKGINLDQVRRYPYAEPLHVVHQCCGSESGFPFQLDQRIINGRRFFEMITHYHQHIMALIGEEHQQFNTDNRHILKCELDEQARKILETLNTYSARNRRGDKYIRTLFDCALIFYVDKFGSEDLSRAIVKLFIWAYRCRLEMQAVQLATMDNYALEHNVFEQIRLAAKPEELFGWPLGTVQPNQNAMKKLKEIADLFRELGYHV
jgi:hypothetical protein